MSAKRTRLDRFLSQRTALSRADVRLWVAQARITVNGHLAVSVQHLVDEFCSIRLDGQPLQNQRPLYIMLNKPVGFLSATQDAKHPVVVDLLPDSQRLQSSLHLVGRLDLHSSGLLLLTNDGHWSQRMISPDNKTAKVYLVTLQNPIDEQTIQGFLQGVYFAYENVVTRPAKLERVSAYVVRVTLWEGRFHQIKRMFRHFGNRVMALHRTQVGSLVLDDRLLPGQSRELTSDELATMEIV